MDDPALSPALARNEPVPGAGVPAGHCGGRRRAVQVSSAGDGGSVGHQRREVGRRPPTPHLPRSSPAHPTSNTSKRVWEAHLGPETAGHGQGHPEEGADLGPCKYLGLVVSDFGEFIHSAIFVDQFPCVTVVT